MDSLQSYAWPGNIRELENVIERAVILTSGSVLCIQELAGPEQTALSSEPELATLENMEKAHIVQILEKNQIDPVFTMT